MVGFAPTVAEPSRKKKLLTRALLGVLFTLLVLASVPAYYWVKLSLLAPTYDVVSIREASSYQSPELLERAWSLPVARSYRGLLAYQSNGSTCGPTSLANVELSWGVTQDERSILKGTGKCLSGYCMGGLSLDVVAEIARQKTAHKVTVLRGVTQAEFRKLLLSFNDPTRRYVVNFSRGPLFGEGGGHFSPIGGYLEDQDLVFVLDVNQSYKPWLVSPERLYEAMNEVTTAGKKRGLLLLQ